MPNSAYLIQSPKGEEISPDLKSKISDAMQRLGIPQGDGWRYVVLPEQNWQDSVQANSQVMPHHTDTAFSNLPAKVTYLRQNKLVGGSNDAFLTTLAHEYGHRKYGTSEDAADKYAKQSVEQYRKYGRSNDGAVADLRNQVTASQSQFRPESAPVETQLSPSLPAHVSQVVEDTKNKAAAQNAWLQQQAQTPQKYKIGQ